MGLILAQFTIQCSQSNLEYAQSGLNPDLNL